MISPIGLFRIEHYSPNMQIKILIVHPSRLMQAALTGLISTDKNFHVVSTLGRGTDLIELLDQTTELFDLILLDPTLEHSELITKIVALSHAKIILLTLDEESPLLETWVKEGVRGVLGCDADFAQLTKAMSKVYAGEFWLNRVATSRLLSTFGAARELTPEQARIALLTAKEKMVIQAIVNGGGQTLRDTAKILKISENTVRNHLTSIYSKLSLANRLELFVFAQQHLST